MDNMVILLPKVLQTYLIVCRMARPRIVNVVVFEAAVGAIIVELSIVVGRLSVPLAIGVKVPVVEVVLSGLVSLEVTIVVVAGRSVLGVGVMREELFDGTV